MKNRRIAGFLTILVLGFLLAGGCTIPSPTQEPRVTPTPEIVYVTVTIFVTPIPVISSDTITPVATPAETKESVDAKLESKWREIRQASDEFESNLNTLNRTSNEDVNHLREFVIPDTISEFNRINDQLSRINTYIYNDLENDRNNLISICDYKIKLIQGTGSYFHAFQAEAFNAETSLEEYENARYLCEDAREIISETSYRTIYDNYVYDDDLKAQDCIMGADKGILRMRQQVK